MPNIKARKDAIVIHLFNKTTIKSALSLDEFETIYNAASKSGTKVMKLGGILFNLSSFDYAEPIKMGSLEQYIESLPPDQRKLVMKRQEQMHERTGRRRESIEEVERYLSNQPQG